MQAITDWAALWRELVEEHSNRRSRDAGGGAEARTAARLTGRRWAKPSAARDFVVSQVSAVPGARVLDIGAGTGAWALLLAPYAAQVTAVEPSPVMCAAMRGELAAAGAGNVTIVEEPWPAQALERHDFSLCSHGMYGSPDLPAFVRSMERATRGACFLVLRAPDPQGITALAGRELFGRPHDSPNFQVAYNVLIDMGIAANVLFEEEAWEPRSSAGPNEALAEVKRRLGIEDDERHDAFIAGLLARRLIPAPDGRLIWPDHMRSALVYWRPGEPPTT